MEVALDAFGAHGVEGASTRKIAAAAGVAMSAITYHYGSKQGLYLAAADYIAERMRCEMAGTLDCGEPIADGDIAGARAKIHAIVAYFSAKMMTKAVDDASMFLVREQMQPTAAFDRVYAGLMGEMLERLVRLVGIATGHDDSPRIRIATLTLLGQVVVFRASRATCLRVLGRETLDGPLVPEIQAAIAANLDAILDRMIAQPEAAA